MMIKAEVALGAVLRDADVAAPKIMRSATEDITIEAAVKAEVAQGDHIEVMRRVQRGAEENI